MQINPTNIDMGALADGQYDAHISWYARAVRAFGHRVIIGFARAMNGSWYSWAWKHTLTQRFGSLPIGIL